LSSAVDLQSDAREFAKRLLPNSWVNFVKGCRYRGYSAHLSYLLKLKKYRAQFARANAGVPNSTVVLPAGCRIHIPAEVREGFEHFGWRDPDMVDEFIGFMKVSSDRNVLWDIGALYGTFSLAFTLGGEGRRALAFEPNPVSRAKMEECLHLNPGAQVSVCDFAVGLPGELVEFESGFHYTAVAGLASRPDPDEVVRQETVSVDELIERDFAPPDLIKIDVEGHEFEVLKGAKKLLLGKKPLLSIELHPDLLNRRDTTALAIAQYLEQAGYVFRDMQARPVKKDYFKRRDNFRVFAI
jgi:FkbM family methyltransferase